MWDWDFVGELAIGLALGIGVGFMAGAHFIEVAFLRVAAHPSVRKLANAADKFTGSGVAGWPDLIGKGLNWLTGGKFMGGAPGASPGKAIVVDTEGNILGETDLANIRRQ